MFNSSSVHVPTITQINVFPHSLRLFDVLSPFGSNFLHRTFPNNNNTKNNNNAALQGLGHAVHFQRLCSILTYNTKCARPPIEHLTFKDQN